MWPFGKKKDEMAIQKIEYGRDGIVTFYVNGEKFSVQKALFNDKEFLKDLILRTQLARENEHNLQVFDDQVRGQRELGHTFIDRVSDSRDKATRDVRALAENQMGINDKLLRKGVGMVNAGKLADTHTEDHFSNTFANKRGSTKKFGEEGNVTERSRSNEKSGSISVDTVRDVNRFPSGTSITPTDIEIKARSTPKLLRSVINFFLSDGENDEVRRDGDSGMDVTVRGRARGAFHTELTIDMGEDEISVNTRGGGIRRERG